MTSDIACEPPPVDWKFSPTAHLGSIGALPARRGLPAMYPYRMKGRTTLTIADRLLVDTDADQAVEVRDANVVARLRLHLLGLGVGEHVVDPAAALRLDDVDCVLGHEHAVDVVHLQH